MKTDKTKEKIRRAIESDPNKDYFKSVKLFGSYLYGNQSQKSDIDLLVEFAITPGMFELGAIGDNLEKKIGKKIDLVTPDSLSKYFKKQVIKEAELVYER